MTTDLTEWIKEVGASAPGAPDFLIERFVREAAIEFCKGTHLWEATLDRINVVADTSAYALTAPAGGEIWKIQSVKYKPDGEDDDAYTSLDPASEREENRHNEGQWQFITSPSPTAFYFNMLTDTLNLYPIPDDASTEGLLIKVIAIPDQSATYVQDFLYQKYKTAITYGTKALMLEEPGQPWTNMEMSVFFRGRFDNVINNAKFQAMDGFTDKQVRVRPRRFV